MSFLLNIAFGTLSLPPPLNCPQLCLTSHQASASQTSFLLLPYEVQGYFVSFPFFTVKFFQQTNYIYLRWQCVLIFIHIIFTYIALIFCCIHTHCHTHSYFFFVKHLRSILLTTLSYNTLFDTIPYYYIQLPHCTIDLQNLFIL
jgi:hypothetical protein